MGEKPIHDYYRVTREAASRRHSSTCQIGPKYMVRPVGMSNKQYQRVALHKGCG